MRALAKACRVDSSFPAQIAVIVSNKAAAPGVDWARAEGLPVEVVTQPKGTDKKVFEKELQDVLARYKPDLVCLAGFMKLLSPDFVESWPDRIVNIHPSLLPEYKGLNTHERALADGKKEVGCTVHFVRPAMDAGPIIVQRRVPVYEGDTSETLAERVLTQEHIAYPEAIRFIGEGRIKLSGERVLIDGACG